VTKATQTGPKKLPSVVEYRVDELARAANTTVRNVRAYQDRGLLEPPAIRGRLGVYGAQHLARLQLIATLLGRGYTLGNIQELLAAVEKGYDVREMLGIQQALAGPWSSESAELFSSADLKDMFNGALGANALSRALTLGILVREGQKFRAPNPTLLRVGQSLVAAGLAMDEVLSLGEDFLRDLRYAAQQIVKTVGISIDKHKSRVTQADQIVGLVQTFRTVALRAVEAEMSRALGESANRLLSERVASFAEQATRSDSAPKPAAKGGKKLRPAQSRA
jgi:DNA-binding transcriptional MerR regulator